MAKRDFTGVFIPAVIWESTSLIPAEKMLLGEIIALSEREGYCYASRSHFAEWLNCTAQNVTYFLNKLERLGFLNIDRTPGFRSKISVNKHVFYGTGKPDLPVNPIDGVVNPIDGGGKPGLPEIKKKENINTSVPNGATTPDTHTPVKEDAQRKKESSAAARREKSAPHTPKDVYNALNDDDAKHGVYFRDIWKVWSDYLEHRKEMKVKPFASAKSEALAVVNLYKMSGGSFDESKKIVEQSRALQWRGLFKLKVDTQVTEQPKQVKQAPPVPVYR